MTYKALERPLRQTLKVSKLVEIHLISKHARWFFTICQAAYCHRTCL